MDGELLNQTITLKEVIVLFVAIIPLAYGWFNLKRDSLESKSAIKELKKDINARFDDLLKLFSDR